MGGVLALAYGGFSYTRETSHARLGPIELSVMGTGPVKIPVWAGAGALVVDVRLLAFSSFKARPAPGGAAWRAQSRLRRRV